MTVTPNLEERMYEMRQTWYWVVLLAVIFGAAVIFGQPSQAKKDQPVCHSVTEDAPILDCDYRNGAWYKK